jgi:hypothetical protein
MRDYQREKVYDWERQHVKNGKRIGFKDIQKYVNRIWAEMGLKYPPKVDRLPKQAIKREGDATRTKVRFHETATEATILHELAHSMTANINGLSHQHNEYFVGLYMVLLEKFLNINMLYLWYTADMCRIKYIKYMEAKIVDNEGWRDRGIYAST